MRNAVHVCTWSLLMQSAGSEGARTLPWHTLSIFRILAVSCPELCSDLIGVLKSLDGYMLDVCDSPDSFSVGGVGVYDYT